MLDWIKNKLFSSEKIKLKALSIALEDKVKKATKALLDAKVLSIALEDKVKKATVENLVREQLAGINTKSFTYEGYHYDVDVLTFVLGEGYSNEDELEFLRNVRDLEKNKAFHSLIDYLVAEQVIEGMKRANSLEALNFARATINGLTLFKDEVERLGGLYDDRRKKEEVEEDYKYNVI